MSRIVFEDVRPATVVDPGRADIACFAGLVARPVAPLPASVRGWLQAQGWLDGPNARPGALSDPIHVPLPFENWPGFTAVFDPGGSATSQGTDYLAEAVRMFFAQGGKRCYVVRTGDPVTPADPNLTAKRQALLGSEDALPPYQPGNPASWRGVRLLDSLPEVSFLAVPDLPALCASQPVGVAGAIPTPPSGPEQFVECATADLTPAQFRVFAAPAPRLSTADYAVWAAAVREIATYLSHGDRREVQLVAAMPLPQDGAHAAAVHGVLADHLGERPDPNHPDRTALSTCFLQLCYPWLKTTGSHVLLESLAPPDGALAGMLARNALARGAYLSATKIVPSGIFDVWPALPSEDTHSRRRALVWGDDSPKPLIERLSLYGFAPAGLRLLSDVTAFPGEPYRTAGVNRLVSVIRRAARRLGEETAFEANGEALWGSVEGFLHRLMTRLWLAGALDGRSPQEAFSVRCDRTTMTQNDLDNGRLVAEVRFLAAASVEWIRVTLAIQPAGASAQEIADAAGVLA